MAVSFNLNSSKIGKIHTLANVAHGSDAVINITNTTIEEMNEGITERDPALDKIKSTALIELGIKDDQEKAKAFQEFINSIENTSNQTNSDPEDLVRKSLIFNLLGKTERALGILSSIVTLGTYKGLLP